MFQRGTAGVLALMLAAAAAVSLCAVSVRFDPMPGRAGKRYGTVVEDRRVRYEKETDQYAAFENLGLEGYGLEEGDEVILLFDGETDAFFQAYPREWYDRYTGTRQALLRDTVMLWITLFLLCAAGYGIYSFRKANPSGKELLCQEETKETVGEVLPGSKIAACAFLLLMVILTCRPQFKGFQENLSGMREMEEVRRAATELSSEIAEK